VQFSAKLKLLPVFWVAVRFACVFATFFKSNNTATFLKVNFNRNLAMQIYVRKYDAVTKQILISGCFRYSGHFTDKQRILTANSSTELTGVSFCICRDFTQENPSIRSEDIRKRMGASLSPFSTDASFLPFTAFTARGLNN
jgi:hypothetical protein